MKPIDSEMRNVVEAAYTSSVNIDEVASLKEMYLAKKDILRLSDRQIQKILGMDAKTLNPILNGEGKQVNFFNVIKLAHFLGISVNDFTKIYVVDMDAQQIGDIQRAREAGYIVEYFDVSTLTKLKFFSSGASSSEMTERITNFFELDSLYTYTDNSMFPAFSRTKRSSSDLMRNFWVTSAMVQFKVLANPNSFNRKELIELIPKIRPFTRDVEHGLIKVLKALYHIGITVLFQPSLERLQVRGATMVVNNKPCIVLSDFQKNYPTLWFTLLHELHHVLFDIEEIEKRTYHITSAEGDPFLMDEEKADNFAQDYLLNESRYKYASGYISSNVHIEKLAKDWGVHPSIIYAIYCYKTNEWAFYNKYIPKMESAIKLLNTHPFDKESLVEAAKQIKQTIYL